MKLFSLFFMIAVLTLSVTIGRAAELVMFEQAGCEWCERWEADVGVIYSKTEEGRQAPIRRIDIHTKVPDDLKHIRLERFTPTFVLIEDGVEIGRIRGYPGEDFFWGLLAQMLKKLPSATKQTG